MNEFQKSVSDAIDEIAAKEGISREEALSKLLSTKKAGSVNVEDSNSEVQQEKRND